MSKTFSTIEDFILVASQISLDVSVTINFTTGESNVPIENQFPFLIEAKDLKLDEALAKMPTALRFELIMLEYEFLLDDLKWDELDGANDSGGKSGRMNSQLIIKYPNLADKADWSKIKSVYLANILKFQPQFCDRVDFSKINPIGISDLLQIRPEFESNFDLNILNLPENFSNWFSLIKKQPQFAKYCDWSQFNEYGKKQLLEFNPSLSVYMTDLK